ncbi:MAG: hypothetical protein K6A62_03225 [Bacteroidales bacterium]|nr:hypothetical protein [Bacteroidales bacterium]
MMYKAIKIFGIAALLLLPMLSGAQQPQSEEEAVKQMREAIDLSVENYEKVLGLEDWQTFYVDSILTHDYDALRLELKGLQVAKMSNADVYQQVQDKWAEQIYVAMQKVLDDKQWAKYLKNGAAREKKARDKRAAKRN